MTRTIALALLLAACTETDDKDTTDSADTGDGTTTTTTTPPDDTGPTVVDPDDDEDGFPASVDCDDTDPAIHPDAVEACDTIDNNCDMAVDDMFAATVGDTSYATLDEALAVAGGTDVVNICPGDWTMTMLERSDDLTLVGIAGRDQTNIMEAQAGTILMVTGKATVTITGLTLTGSVSDGIIVADAATLRMEDSRVSGHQGTGIAANVAGMPMIELTNTDVEDNVSDGDGGGISLLFGASASLTNCNVRRNQAANGGGIFATPAFGAGGTITLDGTTITENDAAVGGGIYAEQTTILGLNGASVVGNTASTDGAGLALYDAPADGLLVSGNAAAGRGGGIAALYDPLYDSAPLHTDLTAVVIDSNTADSGAGLYVANNEDVTLDKASAVTLNVATTGGGGAQLTGGGADLVSNGADWGTPKVNDNAPSDVTTFGGDSNFDGPSTFECNGLTGCGL